MPGAHNTTQTQPALNTSLWNHMVVSLVKSTNWSILVKELRAAFISATDLSAIYHTD